MSESRAYEPNDHPTRSATSRTEGTLRHDTRLAWTCCGVSSDEFQAQQLWYLMWLRGMGGPGVSRRQPGDERSDDAASDRHASR